MNFSTKYNWVLGTILLGALLLAYQNVPFTQAQRLDKLCQEFGKGISSEYESYYKKMGKVNFFYSKRLDTCVQQAIDELGNDYTLCDIKRAYIKRDLTDPSICGGIFQCDAAGVDNVILSKAEEYNGYLFQLRYSEYMDDGEGGEPRTLKTPDKPYNRQKCKTMFDSKLQEIR